MEEPAGFRICKLKNGRPVVERRVKLKDLPRGITEQKLQLTPEQYRDRFHAEKCSPKPPAPTIEELAKQRAAELTAKGFPEDPDMVAAYRELYEVLTNRREPPGQCQDLFAQTPPPGSPGFGTQLHSAFLGLRGKQDRSALRWALERCVGKTNLAGLYGPLEIFLKNGRWSCLEYKVWGSYENEINLQVLALLLDEAEARLARKAVCISPGSQSAKVEATARGDTVPSALEPERILSRVSSEKFQFAGYPLLLSDSPLAHLEELWKARESNRLGQTKDSAAQKNEDRIRKALRGAGATRKVCGNTDEASLILYRGRLYPDYRDNPRVRRGE